MAGWPDDNSTTPRTPAQLEQVILDRIAAVDTTNDAALAAAIVTIEADIASAMADAIEQATAAAGGMFNVKSAQFAGGALGDGVHDDTAAINAALEAARVAGGGTVLLPPGTYMVTGLTIGSYVTLRGSGIDATRIKLIDGTTADVLKTRHFDTLTNTNPLDLAAGGTDVGAVKFHLRELTIDGNKAGGCVGWCARIFGVSYTVDHVEFWNGKLGGVYSEWRSTTGGRDMETFWSNFKIKEWSMGTATVGVDASGGGSFGLFWNGPHDTFFVNGVVATLDSLIRPGSAPPSIGIYLAGQGRTIGGQVGGAAGEIFANVHVWGRCHYGFFPDNDPIYCTNCVAEGAFTANVLLSLGSVWAGGTVYGNNGASSANEVGFQVGQTTAIGGTYGIGGAANCSRATVIGVFMNNFSSTGKCFDFLNTAGNNQIRVAAALGGSTTFYKGTIFPTGDDLHLIAHDRPTQCIITMPKYVRFTDGYNIKTKAGPPTAADFGYADYISIDTILGFQWLHGAVMFDQTNHRHHVQTSGVWYGSGQYTTVTDPQDLWGAGTPEAVVTAPKGSTFRRSDGGAATSFYVKESGAGNTGWVAK